VALDARTGRLLWRTVIDKQPRSDVFGSPAIWNGLLFIGQSALFCEVNCSQEQLKGLGGSVVALNLGARPDLPQGAIVWKTRTVAGPEGGRDGGKAVVGVGQKSGVYWAFEASDATNVTPVWSTRPVAMGSCLCGILATSAVAGGDVFGGSGGPGGIWSLSGGAG